MPILWQVAGIACFALLAVMTVGIIAVLTMPASNLSQMSVAQAVRALRGEAVPGLKLEAQEGGTEGRNSPLLVAALSEAMAVPEPRLRAAWLETPTAVDAEPATQAVTLLGGQEAVVEMRDNGFVLFSGAAARLDPSTPLPAFAASVRGEDGAWLRVAPDEPLLTPWRLRLILFFLVSALLLTPLVLLVARRLTEPIRALAEAADQVRLTPDRAPVPLAGPPEIRAAASALSAMRDRFVGEVARRSRMLAAVAHDLRNPLTGLRMRAETAAEPDRTAMIADIDRMSAMIVRVLDYVRGREVRMPRVPRDCAELVAAWVDEARQQGLAVEMEPAPQGPLVSCAPEELRRAFVNLLDNAIRFGGNARTEVLREGGWAVIRVEDSGPGIDPGDVERLLDPFERLDESRSTETGGVGLGLAICREIVEAHGGRLELKPRTPRGLCAEIRLPSLSPEGLDTLPIDRPPQKA